MNASEGKKQRAAASVQTPETLLRLLSVLIDLTKEGMNRSNCLLTNPMIGQAGVKQERIALSQKLSASNWAGNAQWTPDFLSSQLDNVYKLAKDVHAASSLAASLQLLTPVSLDFQQAAWTKLATEVQADTLDVLCKSLFTLGASIDRVPNDALKDDFNREQRAASLVSAKAKAAAIADTKKQQEADYMLQAQGGSSSSSVNAVTPGTGKRVRGSDDVDDDDDDDAASGGNDAVQPDAKPKFGIRASLQMSRTKTSRPAIQTTPMLSSRPWPARTYKRFDKKCLIIIIKKTNSLLLQK